MVVLYGMCEKQSSQSTHLVRSVILSLRNLNLVVVVLFGLAFPNRGSAADNDTREASGTVVTAITVSATQNLEFGNVLQGLPKTMGNNNDDSTGIFTVTGDAAAGISLQLVLPQYLTLSGGSDRMTIIFAATSFSIDTSGTASPSTVTGAFVDINPLAIPAGVVIGSGGTSKVFLGGKVVPLINQTAGAYSGDIVLSVTYNGT